MKMILHRLGFTLVLLLPFTLLFAEVEHLKIFSETLNDSTRIIVATPSKMVWDRPGGYALIIMLHGWSGEETQWEKDADLQLLADQHDLVLALPDGGYDGWWLDSYVQKYRRYESFLLLDLKPWLIKHYSVSTNSRKHGIMGLSMGGYGSMIQVLKHPREYGAAASLSGVMDITRHPKSWGLETVLGAYQDHVLRWQENNPLTLTQSPPPLGVPPILLICGVDDFAFQENQALAHQMERYGYSARLKEAPGAHTHDFWQHHVGTAIDFIAQKMGR